MTESQPAPSHCQRCGKALESNAELPVCAACALEDALESDSEEEVDVEASAAGSEKSEPLGKLGPYELRAVIGRGGMGVVYRAWHPPLNRDVAVKVLAGGAFASPEARKRLKREATVLARINHPGIVAIHDFGEGDGGPWFSMDLVEGPSLAQLIQDGPLEPDRAAEIVFSVAEAVEATHAVGVLHRDLKPSNILLGPDDQARVTDFGLALDAQGNRRLTQTGQSLGTPSYFAPEQVSSAQGTLGPTTDVYGLGAVLYHLLTGRPPFAAARAAETIQHVLSQEPISPRRLNPTVPHELAAICLRCLRKNPVRRYASADLLAKELATFIRRADGKRRRFWPVLTGTARGRAFLLWAGIGVFLAVGCMVMLATIGLRQNRVLRAELNEAVDIEADLHEANEQADYAHQIASAHRALLVGDRRSARRLLQTTSAARRGWEHGYLQACVDAAHVRLVGHLGPGTAVAFPPRTRELVSLGNDLYLRVWNIANQHQLRAWTPHSDVPTCIAFTPDGSVFYTGGEDGAVREWSLDGGEPLYEYLTEDAEVTSLALAGSPMLIAVGDNSGLVRVWQEREGQPRRILQADSDKVNAVALSSDGRWLAAGGYDGITRVWSIGADEPSASLRHGPPVRDVVFSLDSESVFSCSDDALIHQWRVEDGAKIQTLRGHTEAVRCLAISLDGALLASADVGGTIWIWSTSSGAPIKSLHGHQGPVRDVAFGRGSHRLASVGPEGDIFLWLLDAKEPKRVMGRHDSRVSALAHASKTPMAASGAWSGDLWLWNTQTETLVRELPQQKAGVRALAISDDGGLVVSGAGDGLCQVVRTDGDSEPVIYNAKAGPVRCLGLSADAELAISGYDEGEVRLWETRTGKELLATRFVPERVICTAFTEDPSEGLLVHVGGTIVRWNLASGEAMPTKQPFRGPLRGASVASAGNRIAVGSAGGSLSLSSLDGSETKLQLPGHSGAMMDVALSSDGSRVATTGTDGGVRVWGVDSGKELLLLRDIADSVRQLAWSNDGSKLVAGDQAGRIWLLGPEQTMEP